MTEAELLVNVLELAKYAGWRACHFRSARTQKGWRTPVQGDPGFPDVVLVKGTQFILAELKGHNGNLFGEQYVWIEAIRQSGVRCYIWRPDDWLDGSIAKILGCEGGVIP